MGGELRIDFRRELGVWHIGRLGLLRLLEPVIDVESLLSCWLFSGAEVFEQGVQAGEDAGFPVDEGAVDVEG